MKLPAPQIPFDFFVPEAPGFDNFVIGENSEAVSRLSAWAQTLQAGGAPSACVVWGGAATGKTHLLNAAANRAIARGVSTLCLSAERDFPDDPFIDARLLCIDDADRLSPEQQGWLFTAFNHVAQAGGVTIASGHLPPARWAMRDDIRTRLASGLAFEILPIPQDALAGALADYAAKRGFGIGNEVLTYLLSHSQRDIASLCQVLSAMDRLSLALKRPVTVPLLRAYLAGENGAGTA